MSKPAEKTASAAGVSGTRKIVSACILLVAVVVLLIELRAGLGQANSAKALARVSSEGLFENLPLSEAQAMLSLLPGSTVIRENDQERVFHYEWISLLRPLIGQPGSEIFLVSSVTDPPRAIAFYTDPEDAKSGFYGDAVPAEDPYPSMNPQRNENPLDLPDAPLPETAPAEQPESSND